MTLQANPSDPHAALRAAERDIAHWLRLLEGDGITEMEERTAGHYIRVAARERRLAREQIEAEHENVPA